jgi:TP901 family phage tail tape measure protein
VAITVAELVARVRSDTSQAEGGLAGFSQSISRTGAAMTRGLTLPILGAGVAIGKTGMDFETTMSRIDGLVVQDTAMVKDWEKQIIALGPATGKGPNELAKGLFFVASAGFRGQEAMDVLTYSAKASAAGLGETEDVAGALTSAMTAYSKSGLTAADATDVLVAAVREGKMEPAELAGVLGPLIPLASNMEVEFGDLAGTLAVMTRTNGDAAGSATALRGVLSALTKPTKQAEETLAEVGLSAAGLRRQIREEGLLATLQTMAGAFGDNEEAMARVFPNIRGLTGVLNVLGQDSEATAASIDSVRNATGALDYAFDAATDTTQFKMNQAIAELKTLMVDMSSAVLPIAVSMFEGLRDVLSSVAGWWASLSEGQQEFAVKAALVVAAIGPALLIFGKLLALLPLLLGPFGLLAAAAATLYVAWDNNFGGIRQIVGAAIDDVTSRFDAFRETVATAFEPFGPIIDEVVEKVQWGMGLVRDGLSLEGATKAVIAELEEVPAAAREAFMEVAENLGIPAPVIDGVIDRFNLLQSTVVTVAGALVEAISSMVEVAVGLFNSVLIPVLQTWGEISEQVFRRVIGPAVEWFTTTILPTLLTWVQAVADWFTTNMPLIEGAVSTALGVVKFIFEGLIVGMELILAAVQNVWPAVQVIIETVVGVIGGIITAFLAILSGEWGEAWEAIKGVFVTIWDGIVKFIGTIPQLILGILQGLAGAMILWGGALLGKMLAWAGRFVGQLVGKVGTLVGGWMGSIASLPGRFMAFLGDLLSRAVTGVTNLVTRVVTNAGTLPGKFISAIRELPGKLIAFFGQLAGRVMGSLINAGRGIVQGLWQGISNMVGWITQKIGGMIGGIVKNVLGFLGIKSPSTVFAAIGEDMIRGLALGIDKTAGVGEKAMDRAIAGTLPSTSALTSGMGATAPGSAAAGGMGGSGVTVVLYADRYMGTMEEARYYSDMIARQIRFQRG